MGWGHVASVATVFILGGVVVGGNAPALLDNIGTVNGVINLVVYYVLFSVTIFAYVRVVSANPGRPCDIQNRCMEVGRAANGKDMRMCQKCNCYKPERCHHCSDCNRCTLKMDHHCPWVNNCVGFQNYKFFFLLLSYATLVEIYTIGLLGYSLKLRVGLELTAWSIAAIVAIGLVGLSMFATVGLLAFHTHLILVNQTTIEQLKGNPVDLYSLGACTNIKMVLGASPAVWCLPCVWGVAPHFDGINWDDPAEGMATRSHAAYGEALSSYAGKV